ncbi:MAG TPA: ATP synthase F1 subunit epsilon [Bacteroidales bacterium]|nr:ATP synthase F1 subunit epsilon [Alphaproteobacteria bacterium]HNW73249.1 ATP synthase F1 subunit epsilon [Bacteroidales bacterium]HPS49820.1 ATP synthase F1 subunit epsilon [Bacteroidales bacterium]
MKVEIVTPDSVIFTSENVELVQLPGIDGSFEVLNNHAPLISVLRKGSVKIINKGEKNENFFEIKGGVIEVLNNKVLILAE